MLICQLTDLHVRPVGQPAGRVSETNMFTERAFRAVARLTPRPDVVVITGDLTECGLDAEYSNLNHLLRRLESFPVFVIPGNHDRRGNLREALKHLTGVVSDPHYVQYTVDDFPVRLVMLDTLVPGAGHGELRAEQLEFLDRTLAAVPDKPTILGMHHPPFACGIAHMDRINLRNTPEFAAIVARHRQVDRSSAAITTDRSWPGWRMPSPRSHPRSRIRWRCRWTRTMRDRLSSSHPPFSCTAGPLPTASSPTPSTSRTFRAHTRSSTIRSIPAEPDPHYIVTERCGNLVSPVPPRAHIRCHGLATIELRARLSFNFANVICPYTTASGIFALCYRM